MLKRELEALVKELKTEIEYLRLKARKEADRKDELLDFLCGRNYDDDANEFVEQWKREDKGEVSEEEDIEEEEECGTQFVESDLSLEEMKELVEVPGKKYSIGKYQVTQALWESVMGNNPSDFKGSSRPVDSVNWMDCVEFCNKLSEKEGLEKAYTIKGEEVECNFDSEGYRLPTEWEWWFAAKANQDFEYSGSDNIDEVAWYRDGSTHGVGQKKPNGFGLYDMSGNVFEWCWDWFDGEYEDIPTEDSTGPSTGSYRVYRGGSWNGGGSIARVSNRDWYYPSVRFNRRGFRFTRTIR